MTGVRRGQWGSAVRAAVAVFVMMLALLALAAQATIAAPAAPPLPAPLATPPKSAAVPRRNTIGPASVMTYYVGTTADSSAASDCTTSTNIDCSLRQAVTLANANTGATNTINFAIPGTGVQTITLATAIDITNPVVIDGYTQSGASANTAASGTNAVLKVRVDGNGGSLSGLVLAAGSGGSTVRGLSVTGFSSLANGAVVGIFIGSAGNVIAGDWLGVAPDGTTDGNYYGIGVLYSGVANTTIGGTALADRNLISGNNTGVALQGGSGNVIEGNLIGTNAAGTGALANSFGGVFIAYGHTSNNTVGGAGAGQANVIAFNGSYGVFIGTDAMDTTDVGITIRGNSIHDNGTAGIALNGGGANDHCDGDSGPNNFQNFPALSAAARAGGNTLISGTLDSTASHAFYLDFYASPTNAPQGQTYLGSSNVITNGGCGASFSGISFPVVTGQPWITATATDVMTGDTSPFSAPLDTAVSIATTAGTPQSTPVTSTFATALKATVTDSTSAGVAGVAVTFTANVGTGGATGTFASSATVITDTNGVATAPTLTANGAAGAFTVMAAVNGLSGTATFNLTNSAAACLVNSLMDPTEAGKTTLRGAVTLLNGGGCASDTVTFDPAVFPPATPQTIILAGGSGTPTLMFTARPLTISGAGAGVIVDGNNAATVFTVDSGVTATLNALTIQHGSGSGLAGGGITNTGALTVTNSTFVGNNASLGAAIFTDGSAVAVANSTFSGNTASGGGGAIAIAAGTLTVTNGTIVGNGSAGGGQIREFGVVAITLTGTIIAEPVGNDLDVQGAAAGTNNLISDGTGMTGLTNGTGGNLVGTTAAPINPLLGVLGSYGGATRTLPLLPGSPAIDAGAAVGSGPAANPVPSTDQRGKPRLVAPDIGAFESQGFTLTLAGGSTPQSAAVGTPFANPLTLSVAANNPVEPVAGGIVTFTPPASGPAATLAGNPATIGAGGAASATATANLVAGGYSVTASAGGAATATFSLTNTAPAITLSPTSLPNGVKGVAYPATILAASGGASPYTFAVTTGALPTGLALSAAGAIGGTPTAPGAFRFTVTATDGHGFAGMQAYSVTVTAAPLVSIAIAPNPTTLKVGQVQQFTATGTYADSSTVDLTSQVTWSSDAPNIISVDTTDKGTGKTAGTAHITATQGAVSGQTTVTVTPPVLTGVQPAPAPASRPGGAGVGGTATPAPVPAPVPSGSPASGGGAPVAAPSGRP